MRSKVKRFFSMCFWVALALVTIAARKTHEFLYHKVAWVRAKPTAYWLLIAIGAATIYTSPPHALLVGWPDIQTYWNSVWWEKWFWVMAAVCAFAAIKISRSRGLGLGLLIGYTMISAIWAFAWPGAYESQKLMVRAGIQVYSGYAFMAVGAFAFALYLFDYDDMDQALEALGWICLLNALTIIAQAALGVPARARGGFFGNPSISGSLIAITAPFFLTSFPVDGWRRIVYAIPVVGVILTGTAQPIGVLAVAGLAYYACEKMTAFEVYVCSPGGAPRPRVKTMRKVLAIAGAALIVIGVGGGLIIGTTSKVGRSPFHSSGRLEAWRDIFLDGKIALGYVSDDKNAAQTKKGAVILQDDPGWLSVGRTWVGQGTGTSPIIVPRIQQVREGSRHQADETNISFEEFRWFHSDWLQFLFENGAIGLAVALLAAAGAFRRAWFKSPTLFASVAAYAACMVFNFPIHMATHAFVGAVLLAVAYEQEPLLISVHGNAFRKNAIIGMALNAAHKKGDTVNVQVSNIGDRGGPHGNS